MAQKKVCKWVCKHCQNVNLSSEAEGEVFYCDACQEARTDENLTEMTTEPVPTPSRKEPQQGKGYGKLIAGIAILSLCGGFFLVHNGGGGASKQGKRDRAIFYR